MLKTIEALKALYVALGGDADDVADLTIIPELIAAIADKVEDVVEAANAKELPEVSATDNGSVLKVADGKWAVGTDNTGT